MDVSQRIARIAVLLTVMVTLGAATPVKTAPLVIDLGNAGDVSGSKDARAVKTTALVIDLGNAGDVSGSKGARAVKTTALVIDLGNAGDVSGSKGARAVKTTALVIDLAANATDGSGAKAPIHLTAAPLVITL